jgi:anti-sigma B factor antagonist
MILESNTSTVAGDITVVALKGRLTLGNTLRTLEDQVAKIAGQTPKLILDLGEIDFVDSAGLGMLVTSAGAARTAGHELVIAAANERVRNILKMTGVDRVLNLAPTREAALSRMTGTTAASG